MKTLTKDIDSSVEELEYNKDFTNGCFTKDSSTDSGFTEGDFDKAGFTQGDFTQGSFTEGSFTQVSFTEGDQTEAAPWERCQEDDHDLGKGDVNEDGFSNGDFNERARLRPVRDSAHEQEPHGERRPQEAAGLQDRPDWGQGTRQGSRQRGATK